MLRLSLPFVLLQARCLRWLERLANLLTFHPVWFELSVRRGVTNFRSCVTRNWKKKTFRGSKRPKMTHNDSMGDVVINLAERVILIEDQYTGMGQDYFQMILVWVWCDTTYNSSWNIYFFICLAWGLSKLYFELSLSLFSTQEQFNQVSLEKNFWKYFPITEAIYSFRCGIFHL